MIGETELIYREEQRFALWLRWLVVLSMVLAVILSIFSLAKMPSEQGPPEILPIVLLIVAGVFVPIAIAVLFWLLKLETEVRSDGLYVRYFPFHIHFKRFSADDLSEYYARKYKPILEYGGCWLYMKPLQLIGGIHHDARFLSKRVQYFFCTECSFASSRREWKDAIPSVAMHAPF